MASKYFYYDCAIKAAYMVKYCGIAMYAFVDDPNEDEWTELYLDLESPIEGLFIFDTGDAVNLQKYFIHPKQNQAYLDLRADSSKIVFEAKEQL